METRFDPKFANRGKDNMSNADATNTVYVCAYTYLRHDFSKVWSGMYLWACWLSACLCERALWMFTQKNFGEMCLSILCIKEILFIKDKLFHYCYIICQMQVSVQPSAEDSTWAPHMGKDDKTWVISESESRSVVSDSLRLHGQYIYTVHGILQARILEWVAYPCSSRSSWPKNWTSFLHCRRILYQLSYQGSPWVIIIAIIL